jgi:hypothetical protein
MLPTWGDLLQISHDLDMTKPATLKNKANFQNDSWVFQGKEVYRDSEGNQRQICWMLPLLIRIARSAADQ